MKKIIFTVLTLFCFATLGFTWTCDETDGCDAKNNNPSDYKTSKNVTVVVKSSEGAYAAASSHLQGTSVYGTSHDSTKIYKLNDGKDAGTAYTTDPGASDSSAFDSGWTAL